jgi:hypothetical protein
MIYSNLLNDSKEIELIEISEVLSGYRVIAIVRRLLNRLQDKAVADDGYSDTRTAGWKICLSITAMLTRK